VGRAAGVWVHNQCGTGTGGTGTGGGDGTGTGTGTGGTGPGSGPGTTGPVTGPVTTTNPSGLTDAQERAHIEQFRHGGSYLLPEWAYKQFVEGKPSVGRPDGLFITTKGSIDKILKDKGDVAGLNKSLGVDWKPGDKIYRVDIPNPLGHNPRLPTGKESGANTHFEPGGYTSGGLPEIVTNPVPSGGIKVSGPITIGGGGSK